MRPRTVLLAATLLPMGCVAAPRQRPNLDTALRAAQWIRSTEHLTANGKTWPPDPEKPDATVANVYHGSAGIVLFLLEAYHTTKDPSFLADARAGANELIRQIPDALGPEDAGLYTGASGIGFALLETYKATGDTRYRRAARRCVEVLQTQARRVGSGVEWDELTGIIGGSAGAGLFLLRAAQELDLPEARSLAVNAGRRLIDLGRQAETGTKWAMSPTFPRLMPNFSHGTAGVAYFLATLYQETGQREFLEAALAGARYLQSIADTRDDGCLIFHHEPGGEDLFYLGWCHGPVGTARLFYRLARVTGDEEWMPWVRRCARSLMTSGIPKRQTPGFWNNISQCCGSAGVAEFFLDVYRVTKDPAYLAFSKRMAADMIERATKTDSGLKWIQAEHRVRPELLVAQTGYMQGAAGVGMLLLHLDAAEQNRMPVIVFPDTPFDRLP